MAKKKPEDEVVDTTPVDETVESEETTVETPEVESTEAESSEEVVTLRALAQRAGFKDFKDDDDDLTVAERLIQEAQGSSKFKTELEQLRQQQQAREAYWQQQLNALRQQPAPAPAQDTPKDPYAEARLLKHWKTRPEWDDRYLQYLKKDEQGNIVAQPGARPDLPELYAKYIDWERDALRNVYSDPHAFAYESLRFDPDQRLYRDIQSIVQHVVGEIQQQQKTKEQESLVSSILEKTLDWSTVKDAEGKPTGLTPEGELYFDYVERLAKSGVTDAVQQDRMARDYVEARIGRKLGTPAETPTEKRKRLQTNFAKQQAQASNSRGNAASPNGKHPAPRRRKGLDEMMLEAAKAEGISLSERPEI